MGERRGGEEGGGGRVISISGGETRIFRVPWLYCIPFRGGAIHFWCDGQTESANALWRGPTPLWCFLQRLCCTISRNNAPPEGFSLFLSREISASSCRGNVTNPRKFHSWPQSARSKDDGWRWDRTRRCFGKKGKRTLIRGVSWCNAGKYGRFLRGRKVKVRRRFFFFYLLRALRWTCLFAFCATNFVRLCRDGALLVRRVLFFLFYGSLACKVSARKEWKRILDIFSFFFF